MNDIIDIADPGWNFNFTIGIFGLLVVALVTAGVLLLLSVILRGRSRKAALQEGAGVASVVGIIGFVGSLLIFGIWGTYDYYGKVDELRVAALEDLGYSNVEFDSGRYEDEDRFVASRDGEYFEGSIVEDGDLRWQVVELTSAG